MTDVLENKGFEVVSVRCKVGATPKERIGIKAEEKIYTVPNHSGESLLTKVKVI